jgi:hypothetical protein
MGNRPTRKSKLAAIAAALVGQHHDNVNAIIGDGVPYRFLELDGQPTGPNSDSVRGTILIWCGRDDIVHRAEVGRA